MFIDTFYASDISGGFINASDISTGTILYADNKAIKTANEVRIDNGLQPVSELVTQECNRTPIQTVDITDIFELCCGGVLKGGPCYG